MSNLVDMPDAGGAIGGKRGGGPGAAAATPAEKRARKAKTVSSVVAYGTEASTRTTQPKLNLHEMNPKNVRFFATADGSVDFLYSPDGSDNKTQYCKLIVHTPPMKAMYNKDTCFPGWVFDDKDKDKDKYECSVTVIECRLPDAIKNREAAERCQAKAFAFLVEMKKMHINFLLANPAACANAVGPAEIEADKWVEKMQADEDNPRTPTEAERAKKVREELERAVTYPYEIVREEPTEADPLGAKHYALKIKTGMVWDNREDAPIPPEVTAEAKRNPPNPHALTALALYAKGKRIKRPFHTIANSDTQPDNIFVPMIDKNDVVAFIIKLTPYTKGKQGINAYWQDNSKTLVKAHHVREAQVVDADEWLVDGFRNVAPLNLNSLTANYRRGYGIIEKLAGDDHSVAYARSLAVLVANGFEDAVAEEIIDELAHAGFLTTDENGGTITTNLRLPEDFVVKFTLPKPAAAADAAPAGDESISVDLGDADNNSDKS